jgi:hypothetical protein
MDRPLWQILLPILLAGVAVQRAAVAAMLFLDSQPLLGSALALECSALLAAAVGILVGGRVALATAVLLAVAFAASAVLGIVGAGAIAVPAAVGKLTFAGLGAAGLTYLARNALGPRRNFRGGASARTGRPALRVLTGGAASQRVFVPRARPRARTLRAAPRGPR